MENLTAVLLTFFAGLIVGSAATALLMPARRQRKQFEQERDEALSTLARHREEVDHHFLRTAELVNQMTASYRAVHDHLSEGARGLCSDQGRRLAMAKSLDSLPGYPGEQTGNNSNVSQPLDYAPSAQGTLSEDFGLRIKAEGPFSPLDDFARPKDDAATTGVEPPRDYAEGCEDQGCSTVEDKRA